MFRKFFIFALFATACGYAFASDSGGYVVQSAPIWPVPGSDADVQFYDNSIGEVAMAKPCSGGLWESSTQPLVSEDFVDCNEIYATDPENVRVVSKIGEDLVVENNFNMGGFATRGFGAGWSGGADLTHPYQAPTGFNIFEGYAEMPLMHTEMMEDDGGAVLAISRSDRQRVRDWETGMILAGSASGVSTGDSDFEVEEAGGIGVEIDANATQDLVRSWVVASGQTLRAVLQEWCDKEGWDLVWNTPREYPIVASAVFKGRFMDVSSALVRNFSRANPIPYAKFYKGNRVLVVSTNEE